MEKLMSSDERIRRAENLYYKRRNLNSFEDDDFKDILKPIKRTLKIIVFCIIVYSIFLLVQNRHYIFTEEFLSDVDRVITVELKEKIIGITNYLNGEDINDDVPKNDSLENDSANYIEATLSIAEDISYIDQMQIDSDEIKANLEIIKPLDGVVTSEFGVRSLSNITVSGFHTGLDIAGDIGDDIISAIDGVVEDVSEYGAYGKHVTIRNGEITTMYAHCSKICVTVGDEVSKGMKIAEVGSTGNSTGPHLHFEVMLEDRYVDPQYLLEY